MSLHRRPDALLAVFVGGVAGTVARWGLGRALPVRDGWPLGTLAANLVGAFLLGLLLESLSRVEAAHGASSSDRRPGSPGRRPSRSRPPHLTLLRLLLGTGFCGAFTTMSALDVEAVLLVDGHRPAIAFAYLAVSLFAGLAFAGLGVLLGSRTGER